MPEIGSVVRCRERDWVLMPSRNDEVYCLRPLAGADEDIVLVSRQLSNLAGSRFPGERVEPSEFPLPEAGDVRDAASARLLWQAARLTLREAAAPLRSLGRISVRPRAYQFVPLLMALRQSPVRLFIADDVGVGKTIEALIIARELLERGVISRLCVLCPPYLCDQWEQELRQKFHLDAVTIRSGTIRQLERRLPPGKRVYEHYPFFVASIDFVKTDQNRAQFLQCCPELVIVDEAHGAAESSAIPGRERQERHRLLRDVAAGPDRHLLLLSATPHSGIEESFRSLLGLLDPQLGASGPPDDDPAFQERLAERFIQRARADIQSSWEKDGHSFPQRQSGDAVYPLSEKYRELFRKALELCGEIIRSGASLQENRQRCLHLGALSLLRCVMSSPEAAEAALANREARLGALAVTDDDAGGLILDETAESSGRQPGDGVATPAEEGLILNEIVEPSERQAGDGVATPAEDSKRSVSSREKALIREIRSLARDLRDSPDDTRLAECEKTVRQLLKEDFSPIVWCRFVPTAEYVAGRLKSALGDRANVVCVTGRLSDDERRAVIDDIDPSSPRVLVATDCLSEGINLQDKFNAVVHYDLPWNPNRLEQREGRVDRFGQKRPVVKAVRIWSGDNPVDGLIVRVLLDKAAEIRNTLGTYVPIPEDRERIAFAIANALQLGADTASSPQRRLELQAPSIESLMRRWEEDASRAGQARARFARRALQPDEVEAQLKAADDVLGSPEEVREFLLSALQRFGVPFKSPSQGAAAVYRIPPAGLPELPGPLKMVPPVPKLLAGTRDWVISFESPTPEGAEYVGRNHPLVTAAARYLLEEALAGSPGAAASRSGAVLTRAVSSITTLLLVRARYLCRDARMPALMEEVLAAGWQGSPEPSAWLGPEEALGLLKRAEPSGNLAPEEKQAWVSHALQLLGGSREGPAWDKLGRLLEERAQQLAAMHAGILSASGAPGASPPVLSPQRPPDILAVLVLVPEVSR